MNPLTHSKGIPIVLSAPSGGGKSTIADKIVEHDSSVVRSISCTTRTPRNGEKEGTDYFFISEDEFKKRIKQKGFLEWAKVHNQYYGTPLEFFDSELDKGKDVMLVIDTQGAQSVRKNYPKGIYIFVVPPTWEVLKERLEKRGTDSSTDLKVRLADAKKELATLKEYDYVVVNESLDEAVQDVLAIIRSEHNRVSRINKKKAPIFI